MSLPPPTTSSPLSTVITSDAPSSVPSFSRPVPSNLHAKTARTYGKPKALIPPTPITSSDAPLQEASSSQTIEQDGTEEDEVILPQPIGRDSSYTIIPETEFEHPEAENDTPKAPIVDRRSRQDRIDEGEEVDEIVDEGLLRREDPIASSPDSLPTSPWKQDFSTDPTTEEEDLESPSRKVPRATSSLQPLLRKPIEDESDASDEDGDLFEGPRETAAEMMARIDRELDEAALLEEAPILAPEGLARLLPIVATSSLTSLESSNLPTSPNTLAEVNEATLTTQHTPVSQSTQSLVPRVIMSPNSEGSRDTNRQPIQKKRKRIIESDAESDEELRQHTPRKSSRESSAETPATASSSRVQVAPVSTMINDLSKKEKLEALARKRAPPPVPEQEEVTRAPMDIGSEEEQEKAEKKSKKRKGALSKKAQLDLDSTTAALVRNQPAHIESMSRPAQSLREILEKQRNNRPTSTSISTPPLSHIITIPSSSVSSIEPADSPRRNRQHIRTRSPISYATPAPSSRRSVPPPASKVLPPPARRIPAFPTVYNNDDDEDLPSLEQIQIDIGYAKQKEAAAKRKATLIASQIAVNHSDSEDSDIEILDVPNVKGKSKDNGKALNRSSTLTNAVNAPRLTPNARKIQNLVGSKRAHIEEDVTDSQLQGIATDHPFSDRDHYLGLMRGAKSSGKFKIPAAPSIDQINKTIQERTAKQNHRIRVEKTTMSRQKERQSREQTVRETLYDPKKLVGNLKDRPKTQARTQEEEEEAEDGDFEANDDEDDDEMGSGSDGESRRRPGIEDEAMESDMDSEEPGVESFFGDLMDVGDDGAEEVGAQEEKEDERINPPVKSRQKVRIAGIISDQSDGSDDEGPSAKRMQLPMNDSAGFSQFFGDDFSQDVREGNATEESGFKSFFGAAVKDVVEVAPNLLNSSQKSRDAALLEAQNAYSKFTTLATPRDIVPRRQYINQNGVLTQTRPDRLYEDSPHDSDVSPLVFGIGGRIPDTESQDLTQTQIDYETPSRHPLKKFDSYGFGLATGAQADTQLEELAATEREDSVGSIGREAETLEPTPAQQTRNAFEILGKSKPTTATSKARREKNEFIATEADLSDEEMGMGAQSGDEDEAGMDIELEELVDNEEVDFETRDEQDRMADDLRRELEEEDDLRNQEKMQGVADGKQRQKSNNALGDFNDDIFDDDYEIRHRAAAPKQESATIASLAANEATRALAAAMAGGFDFESREEDIRYLLIDNDEMNDLDGKIFDKTKKKLAKNKVRQGRQVSRISEEEDNTSESELETENEEEEIIINDFEMDRRAKEAELNNEIREVPQMYSSSPQSKHRIKSKLVPSKVAADRSNFDEAQYRSLKSSKALWKGDSKGESQGNANGTTSGAMSSVTGFIAPRKGAKAVYGGTLEAGSHGKTNMIARTSKFGGFKKNNFTTT